MSERQYTFESSAQSYLIGKDIRLNTHTNSITQGERLVELENRLVLLLVYFIHHQGEVLSKDLLLRTIWQGKVVNDDSLSVAVSHLRKALGDSSRSPRFIKTLPGVGYQFIGAAQAVDALEDLSEQPVLRWLQSRLYWLAIAAVVVCLGIYVWPGRVSTSNYAGLVQASSAASAMAEANRLLTSNRAEDWREAIKRYQGILRQMPLAEAYLGIADAKAKLLNNEFSNPQNCREIVGLLHKALTINSQLASAHLSLANAVFWCQRDYAEAETHYRDAIRLDPHDDRAPMFYASLLLAQGRFTESLAQVDASRQLNPLNYSVPTVVWIYEMQGRDDLALQELQRILSAAPDDRYYHISAQRIFNHMGNDEKTFAEWLWLMRAADMNEIQISAATAAFQQGGLVQLNRWLLDNKIAADLGDYEPPLSWARYALVAGDKSAALDYLEAAWANRQSPLLWMAVDPAYESVRKEPRFKRLLDELKQTENK